jgi:monofunctional biosynthetic peptidoglycan transglycosylase
VASRRFAFLGKSRLRRWLFILFCIPVAYLVLCVIGLIGLRFVDPILTMVQAQRLVEAVFGPERVKLSRDQVELAQIAPALRNAVVAGEDARFWTHHGIDFVELREVAEDALENGEMSRGGSTITQQLVKNLFFTTHRNPLRKVAEFVLAPVAEVILPKDRILELYINNAEWGRGIYGAEAAARAHYGVSARRLSRDQAERLAAVLPAPRRWLPARMNNRARIIDERMRQMGR